MTDSAQRLANALARIHGAQFAPAQSHDQIVLTSVQQTSTGAPEYGIGTIDGAGAFRVGLRGWAVAAGDTILARRTTGGAIGAEYEIAAVLASDNPGAGYLLID